MLSLGAPSTLVTVDRNTHVWNNLDEKDACDFFELHELTLPAAASTLADRDATYFYFDVVQDSPGAFTPFDWAVDTGANGLSLTLTENLAELGVRTLAAGLDPTQPLDLWIEAADGTGDVVILDDYAAPPIAVERDDVPDGTWVWEASTSTLRIQEDDGAGHRWEIFP